MICAQVQRDLNISRSLSIPRGMRMMGLAKLVHGVPGKTQISNFNVKLPLKISGSTSSIINLKGSIVNKTFIQGSYFYSHCRAMNRIGPHNIDIISVFIGLLLGSGNMTKKSGEGARMSVKQRIKDKEYLLSLYNFIYNRGYCSSLHNSKSSHFVERESVDVVLRIEGYTRCLKANNKTYYEFNTYTFRSLIWLHKLFYKNGKKVIPANIKELITPLALTIWISEAGCWTGSGIKIFCNSFNLEEVKLLKEVLTINFELEGIIQKDKLCECDPLHELHDRALVGKKIKTYSQRKDRYSIYINKSYIFKIRTLILPYLHESMYHKVGL
jgi:hypothetical protein